MTQPKARNSSVSNASEEGQPGLAQQWVEENNNELLEQLYERYYEQLRAMLSKTIPEGFGGRISPSEMIQSAICALIVRAQKGDQPLQFKDDDEFRKLLFTIAKNKVLSRLRRPVNRAPSTSGNEDELAALQPMTTEVQAECKDTCDRLLTALNDREKEYLLLCLDGHSRHEIATCLDISQSTITRIAQNIRLKASVLFPQAESADGGDRHKPITEAPVRDP